MTRKLTKMEKNAKAWCEGVVGSGHGAFTVEWVNSKNGLNPHIDGTFGRMTRAGGGGYDKASTVLSDLLRWLFPRVEPKPGEFLPAGDHWEIARLHGHGVFSVQRALARRGWLLECVASVKRCDTYTIRRKDGAACPTS